MRVCVRVCACAYVCVCACVYVFQSRIDVDGKQFAAYLRLDLALMSKLRLWEAMS